MYTFIYPMKATTGTLGLQVILLLHNIKFMLTKHAQHTYNNVARLGLIWWEQGQKNAGLAIKRLIIAKRNELTTFETC